ncbi:peptide chain release factor 1 [Linderina pennispora]|uniref:Peptide chain release factor 1 n=1 Tax=Linderina pennispora TaxID=61395 RepID=A0A1Y1WDA3_9FUNG|nr:peptide chain release factor 1 [Linderina pennispora]ORX71509.1 peptide chain release factor 1 [Linderina pennispora]
MALRLCSIPMLGVRIPHWTSAPFLRRYSSAALKGSELVGKSNLTPRIIEKLKVLEQKFEDLTARVGGDTSQFGRGELDKLSKDLSDVGLIVLPFKNLQQLYAEVIDLQDMIESDSAELRKMAQEERQEVIQSITQCESEIIKALLPKDKAEKAGAILEIRAGTGGDEASLFSGDLLRMYERYAQARRWKFGILSKVEDGDKVKEAVAEVSGRGVFGALRFESGVHRVQRVPATESQGRIHTSTIEINEKDLRFEAFRASGKGGQHVNTTDSAVRITHIPTGIAVENQQERSQLRNKEKAMQILRARLYERERQKLENERRASRNKLIGSGDRSEKCRTYNYAQNRVTDHRVNFSLYDLEGVMSGQSLQHIIDQLRIQHDLDELADM